jgi:hypothetical protein
MASSTLPAASLSDVCATMAQWLGVTMPESTERAIAALVGQLTIGSGAAFGRRRLADSKDPATRAAALMRIVRVQRTAGEVDGALLVYRELIRDDEKQVRRPRP